MIYYTCENQTTSDVSIYFIVIYLWRGKYPEDVLIIEHYNRV